MEGEEQSMECGICGSDEEEGGRRPTTLRNVQKVSKQEREEHELTHCPFRVWCKYCVEGRAYTMMHKSNVGGDKGTGGAPRISMDYFT